ncbi:hypothetical protein [Nocardioides sp. P5_C9_2]
MSTIVIRRVLATAGVVAAGLLAVGAPVQAAETASPGQHHPTPSHFTRGRVTNPYFPLEPGTVLVYRGVTDGRPGRDVVYVAPRTRVIDGVRCRVVVDRLVVDGVLTERTRDYYAQTRAGTVWYFGEDTAELDEDGTVTSREGTFHSGRDGAEAGIFMPAHPRVGQGFHQEDYPGHAEDRFVVRSLHASVTTVFTTSRDALLTAERSALEPGVVEHKLYVRGVGDVADRDVRGGSDQQELVAVRHR